MNNIDTITLPKLLITIGQQQAQLVARGQAIAQTSQKAWNTFVATLLECGTSSALTEKKDLEIKKIYDDLSLAVAQYNQLNQTQVSPKTVYHYIVGKILRSVSLNPDEFPNDWYFVCQSSEIPNSGDYVTVKILQEPLVVLRQEDGNIRSFLNVCTHRQSPVFEGRGCLGAQQNALCPYHGWAFSRDGDCKNAPGATRGEFGKDFKLENYSLQEIPVKVFKEQVFVQLIQNDSHPEETEDFNFSSLENIPLVIANFLNNISPGYNAGETALLPEEIRLWLKIGYLAQQLKLFSNELDKNFFGENICLSNPKSEKELIFESLLRELRQAILTVENKELTLKIEDIFEGSSTLLIFPSHQKKLREEISDHSHLQEPLPIWIYGDSAFFSREIEHLIAPTWQFVCHINEVPKPEDFSWLDIVGERAYVIRTETGELFAGRLKNIDERHIVPDIRLPNYGLDPIDIDVFYGFIFIRFSWDGPRLKDIWYQTDLLNPYKLEEMQPIYGSGCYDIYVEVDYKLLWENFLEDYHFPMMHKGLTRRFGVSSDCEGINGMIIPMKDPPSPHLNSVERKYYDCAKFLARHSWEYEKQLQRIAANTQSLPEPLCYSAFCSMSSQETMPMPFSLSIFPEHTQTFSIVPGGARESRFHIRSYGHKIDPNSPVKQVIEEAQLANIQLLFESLHEDIRVNYITQDSVSSRLFKKRGIFSIAELDVAKFQQAIRVKIPLCQF